MRYRSVQFGELNIKWKLFFKLATITVSFEWSECFWVLLGFIWNSISHLSFKILYNIEILNLLSIFFEIKFNIVKTFDWLLYFIYMINIYKLVWCIYLFYTSWFWFSGRNILIAFSKARNVPIYNVHFTHITIVSQHSHFI